MPEVEKYAYESLLTSDSPEETEIRLMHFLPETDRQMIACRLERASLSQRLQYVAISYTWDSPLVTKEIRLNNKRFFVRENLWWCLYNMQISKRDCLFWIDAICINQDNILERSHQVQRMSLIYTAATTVVVWLGRTADESNLAIDYIAQKDPRRLCAKGTRFSQIWSSQQGRAVLALCERPYWTRVWIIQEVMMARNITVFCGDKNFEWRDIERTFNNLELIAKRGRIEHHQYVANVLASPCGTTIEQKKSWECLPLETQAFSLKYLLEKCHNHRSTDVRDKIYALLGLTDLIDPSKPHIYVDYSRSVEDIYRDVLQCMHDSSQLGTMEETLGFISILQHSLRLDSSSERVKLETNRVINRSGLIRPWYQ